MGSRGASAATNPTFTEVAYERPKRRKSKNRLAIELSQQLRKADEANDPDRIVRVMSRYGKEVRRLGMDMYLEQKAKSYNMTLDEYKKKLDSIED
jgi:hypothetical protein